MASSKDLSSGLGWKDVAGNLVAFEAINGCRLEIRLSTADYHGRADLAITALAHDRKAEIGDQSPLASASVTILGTRLKSLEGALIHALYVLDAEFAENALREIEGG